MQIQNIRVLYNAACPVCNAGICEIQTQMGNRSQDIDWVNVHVHRELLEQYALELENVREKLHLIDANGQIRIGVDAFMVLWLQNNPNDWKVQILEKNAWLKKSTDFAYAGFAKALYTYNRLMKQW